jgi:Tfp pilus assembly protein PilF
MLLQLWAYFDNQDLWFELLREGRNGAPDWLCQITEDELSFNQAVRVLCDHGLVEVDKSSGGSGYETKGYGMHSCVHSWTICVLNQDWDAKMGTLALECVGRHLPDQNQHGSLVTERRLIRHAARSWGFIVDGSVNSGGREHHLHRFGDVFSNHGQFDEAEKMYQRALQGREKAWGLEHTSTLATVNNLGNLYKSLGRLDEAEKMYQRALQGKEKAWGLEHTSTLNTVNNLGNLYKSLGWLDEAEKMYQRALQGKEKAWGLEHTSTLDTVNNLGILYADLGRLDEAEKMYQQALQGFEKRFGYEHEGCRRLRSALATL